MEYLSLGKIVDSFGLDGTVKIYSTTNLASKRYKAGNKLYFVNPQNNEKQEVTVVKFRHSGFFDFVKFEEFDNPESVKELKGYYVEVEKNNKDLDKDHYFYSDLRGCKVIDENNKEVGVVKEVEEFPAQLTLRVRGNNDKDFFVPFISEFVKDIKIDEKIIQIHVIEGLLWKSQS